jgi:hypothetical protein
MRKLRVIKKRLMVTLLLLISFSILVGCTSKIYFKEKSIETSIMFPDFSYSKSINVVVVQKNILLSVSLYDKAKNTILDRDGVFFRPIISPSKAYVAYIKDKALYITNGKLKPIKIADNIDQLSFSWKDVNNLIYSPTSGGLYMYNISTKTMKPYIKNEFNYQNIIFDSKKGIYAEKYHFYKNNGSDYRSDYGIAFLNPSTKEENIVIKSIPNTIAANGNLGMYPVIIELSKDDKYLYIWKHPHSGSMAADGVEFATYDISNNKLIEYISPNIISLAYKDNISPNPKDSRNIAFIYGSGREMSNNKHLILLDVLTGKFRDLLPKSESSMTPNYLSDGKTIVYAASEGQKDTNYNLTQWLSNGKHHIYGMDATTSKVSQLTNNPNYFDFSPKYISNKLMVFFRSDKNDNVSLWKLDNGKEAMLADSLIFYNTNYHVQNYYGHYYTEFYSDIVTLN